MQMASLSSMQKASRIGSSIQDQQMLIRLGMKNFRNKLERHRPSYFHHQAPYSDDLSNEH